MFVSLELKSTDKGRQSTFGLLTVIRIKNTATHVRLIQTLAEPKTVHDLV